LITGLDSQPHIQTKNMSLYINHAPRYYITKSRYPSRPFFGTQPRRSFDHRRAKSLKLREMERPLKCPSIFHALVFFLVYSLVAKAMGLVLTKTDLIVTTTLFLALSPGLLLTIPPGSGGLLRSGQTSLPAALTHSVVFRDWSSRFCVVNFLSSTK
jgi:hypothetical protein